MKTSITFDINANVSLGGNRTATYESADNIADIFFDWIKGRSLK